MKLGKGKNPIKLNIRPEEYHKLVRKNRYKKPLLPLPKTRKEIPSDTYKPNKQEDIEKEVDKYIEIFKQNQTFLTPIEKISLKRNYAWFVCELCERVVQKHKYRPLPYSCGSCIPSKIKQENIRDAVKQWLRDTTIKE